jgi:phage minor structural protein
MYKIKLKQNNSTTQYTLHDTSTNDLILLNPKLSLALNKTGTLTFSVPVTHPYYDKIGKMQCELSVYKGSKTIYVGRPLTSEEDFYKTSSVTCEGILAYLIDSIQRPYSFTGSIKNFLSSLLTNHNNQVDSFKQFILGVCDVADSNNYINRSDSGYTDSLTTVNNKLINTHGGYLSVRYGTNTRYIDYKAQPGKESTQVIRFGDNLLDLNKYIKSENLITAIIPLGAETEEVGINDTKKRVTIESVNIGKDYLADENAVKQFGYIYKPIEFDDVTEPANLKAKGQKYLNENKNLSLTIELSAIDLSVIDLDIETFSLGDSVRVVSKPHDLDSYFIISEYSIDLADPSKNTITLGKTLSKLSQTVNKNKNDTTLELIKKTDALNRDIYNAVENATNLITGSSGGYLYIKKNADGQPEELYILDTPSIDDATNCIRLNKNGLGFSRTGYNGIFQNAWTIDGSLVADFITTGTLNADLIKTGKIKSSTNSKVYFDLTNGVLSGSILIDPIAGSDLYAKFGTSVIDNISFKGLTIYDSNSTDSTGTVADVGGIIRYADDTDSTNIGLYSRGILVMSANGVGANGSKLQLNKSSLQLIRGMSEDESFTGEQQMIIDSTSDYLHFSFYQASSQYGCLNFEKDYTLLFQAFQPTTGTGTETNSGVKLERGKASIIIRDNEIMEVSASGAKVNGVTVTSDRTKKWDIKSDKSTALDKLNGVNTYHYKLIDDNTNRYGFMADELPSEMLAEDKKSVDLYASLAVAVKAIKELSVKVEKLENEIKELKRNG